LRPEDVEPAWHGAVPSGGRGRVLVEMVVDFDHEITILTVRDRDGALTFCEPIGHRQVDGSGDVVLEAWQPQWVSPIATDSAHSIAARVVNALGGSGVYGVELLVHDDEVYFSDVTGYPPGTGLVTLRSQRLSMFDLHARATLGLPVDTIMVSPAAAEVVYADVESEGADREPGGRLIAALSVPESDVRIFSPARGYPRRRRIGLALATGPDVATARDRIRQMSGALHRWWR
jgi:phosphoribosylglycinamide formyltransferase 2